MTSIDYGSKLSGVPQGLLGLLLFLLFVKDLPDWVHKSMRMFADDTKIWAEIIKCKVMQIAHNFVISYKRNQESIEFTKEE